MRTLVSSRGIRTGSGDPRDGAGDREENSGRKWPLAEKGFSMELCQGCDEEFEGEPGEHWCSACLARLP